jgi:hypothetical protein
LPQEKKTPTRIPKKEGSCKKEADESGFSALPKKFDFINSTRVEN